MKWVVLGGDMRMIELANHLARDGQSVSVFLFDLPDYFLPQVHLISRPEELADTEIAVLPLPVSRDKSTLFAPFSKESCSLETVFSLLPPHCKVFGGKLSASQLELAGEHGLWLEDYLCREEFAVANAVPTAEGAIQIAMEQLRTTLADTKCLVTGFGRVGQVLADRLLGLKANVSVLARRAEQRVWSEIAGCSPISPQQLSDKMSSFSLIFNTVPARIFKKEDLQRLPTHALLIELASSPGGFDAPLAGKMGLKVISAQALPGKVAPETAGNIILATIRTMLEESHHKEAN